MRRQHAFAPVTVVKRKLAKATTSLLPVQAASLPAATPITKKVVTVPVPTIPQAPSNGTDSARAQASSVPSPSVTSSAATSASALTTTPSKRSAAREAKYRFLCLLADKFPDIFVRSADVTVRPLSIGIRAEVLREFPNQTSQSAGRAIALYLSFVREPYLRALAEGHERIHLDGSSAGPPSPDEREFARRQQASVKVPAPVVKGVMKK
jgi:ProP effector